MKNLSEYEIEREQILLSLSEVEDKIKSAKDTIKKWHNESDLSSENSNYNSDKDYSGDFNEGGEDNMLLDQLRAVLMEILKGIFMRGMRRIMIVLLIQL